MIVTHRKTICFLMPVHYLVAKGGGAETQVGLVMEEIGKIRKYDIHFLCRVVPDYQPTNHKVWKIGSENGLGKFWTFIDASRIYRTLKQISPQIIYQNVGSAHTGIAAFYARRYGAKLIWHIASDYDVKPELVINIKRRFIKLFDRLFLNYGIRNAHLIAAQTQYQNSLLEKGFGRKCDAYIPIGHPYPENVQRQEEKVTVLWVAGMKPLKQPEIFVRLAREIGKADNVRFAMMGSPSVGKWFSMLMREIKAVPNLTYLGYVSHDEVIRHLGYGHLLVNTSRFEGFSNTFVEAWMHEVPVVSLNADPDNVLVREGIGFHSVTFEGLCRDVKLLVENNILRKEMGERARKYAFQNHSVDKMVRSFTTLIESK